MRRRIAVFGGSLFKEVRFENNTFNILNNKTVSDLKNKYDIDNYSCKGLNSDRVLRLVKNINVNELYSTCIIALGENEVNDRLFELNLSQIIGHLLVNNVRPILVSLPLSFDDKLNLQDVIDRLSVDMNVDYIYNGLTDKQVSYIVKDKKDMKKAILELC